MKGERSLDQCCTLVQISGEPDEVGNIVVQSSVHTERLCAILPTHAAEYHAAGQRGIRTEQVLELDADDYEGQERVDFQEVRYRVYRTYRRDDGRVELYLTGEVAHNG